jgi:aldehyde dehydrogenase
MAMQKQEIEAIISEVVNILSLKSPDADQGDWGIFEHLDHAVAAANTAYQKIPTIALREKIVSTIRSTARENAKRLAEMAVEETGMGRIEDKIKKISW